MLVLTRKQQEKIQIGENITITVLRTKGKAVRLGIEAPGSVPVFRGELAARQESQDAQPAEQPEAEAATTAAERQPRRPSDEWEGGQDTSGVVSMQRVPRSRVSTVLPQMLGPKPTAEAGPLRLMLDRRGAASQA